MNRTLNIVAFTAFAANLSMRCLDPVLPQIGEDLAIDPHVAALLSTAFAFPYAIVQPFLGAFADVFGKIKLLIGCLVVLALAAIAGAMTSTFPILIVTRVITGAAAGGVFPIALALAGDLVPVQDRQVAIARLIASALTGTLVGAIVGGTIADLIGWRGVLVLAAVITVLATIIGAFGLGGVQKTEPHLRPNLKAVLGGYRTIFKHPNAPICFSAVFIEGICIFGVFPYVAALLLDLGEPRLSIAGIVIAGFGLGGVFYSFSVGPMLRYLGERRLMIAGAVLVASQFIIISFGPPWQVQFLNFLFVGIGFYSVHGALQIYATELAPHARASAIALHACFFFIGQATGPIAFGYGLIHAGIMPTFAIAAVAIVGLGLFCAKMLRHHVVAAVDQPRPR